jgi:O-antigen ligase
MPPLLALFLCLGFIAWLFWRDSKQRRFASRALWIPFLWLFVIGSRPVSYWFGGGNSNLVLEGNPINTLVFTVLIVSAILVLQRRNFNWAAFVHQNKALCLIYLFFAISAAWSPLGIVSLKRLFKDFGGVLVVLVLLTEHDPVAAIQTVFVRVSYLLFPLSILVDKYFPSIGRNYTPEGGQMVTGLTTQKNSLGEVLVVFGMMLLWDLLELRKENVDRRWKTEILVRYGLLAMGGWLLLTCDSVTSMICLLLGLLILWGGSRLVRMQNGRQALLGCLVGLTCMIGVNKTFGISDAIIHAFGRNTDLTDRTYIWQAILDQKTNPLVGCGFYSFWNTQFGQNVNLALGVEGLGESHNGYLETFVDGGVVGEGLLVVLLLAAGARSLRRLFDGSFFGRMSLAFWMIAILSNISEANFFRLGPIWFAFLLLTTECPCSVPALGKAEEHSCVEDPVSQSA